MILKYFFALYSYRRLPEKSVHITFSKILLMNKETCKYVDLMA
jgi:hypothetical protein